MSGRGSASRSTYRLRWSTALLVTAACLLPAPLATPSAAATTEPQVRWVAVSAATLWVRPGIARTVDHPSLTRPAHPGRWVHSMTVEQKRWLYGRLETQALYGDEVEVLETSGTWSRVVVPSQRTPRDSRGYPGWLPTVQLTSTPPAATGTTALVRKRTASVWRSPAEVGVPGARVMRVSYDTRLPVVALTGTYVEVVMLSGRHRALARSAVKVHETATAWQPTRAQVLTQARKMLGLPYLWAGVSGFGYDCSGFTYAVYDAIGVRLRRDADAQAQHGTAVARADLAKGDLIFFRDSSGAIVHEAIYYGWHDGARSVIQSPGTGSAVQITPLSAWPRWRYAGARRYLDS